jgi:hypothetical protein
LFPVTYIDGCCDKGFPNLKQDFQNELDKHTEDTDEKADPHNYKTQIEPVKMLFPLLFMMQRPGTVPFDKKSSTY